MNLTQTSEQVLLDIYVNSFDIMSDAAKANARERGKKLFDSIVNQDADYLYSMLVVGQENRRSWDMFCAIAGVRYHTVGKSKLRRLDAVRKWCGPEIWSAFLRKQDITSAEEQAKRKAYALKVAKDALEKMMFADPNGDVLVNGKRCISAMTWLKQVIADGYTEPAYGKHGAAKCVYLCRIGEDTASGFPIKNSRFWPVIEDLLGKKIQ